MADLCARMQPAIEQAKRCAEKGIDVPVGCVIYKDGQILAAAYNTRQQNRQTSEHAEINAIRQACEALGDWRLTGCEMYVTLEPCPMCAGAIAAARVTKLVYGCRDDSGDGGAALLPMEMQVYGGICAGECAEILSAFFQQKRTSL